MTSAVLGWALAACGDDDTGTVDARTGADAPPGTADAPPGAVDAPPGGADAACDPAQTPTAMRQHHEGENCVTCHNGTGAPLWTAAGTVYTDANGTAGVGGATVHLVDANGNEVTVVTAADGNFRTDQALALPLHPRVSLCPDTVAMLGNATSGGCNSCHTGGMRIHIP